MQLGSGAAGVWGVCGAAWLGATHAGADPDVEVCTFGRESAVPTAREESAGGVAAEGWNAGIFGRDAARARSEASGRHTWLAPCAADAHCRVEIRERRWPPRGRAAAAVFAGPVRIEPGETKV